MVGAAAAELSTDHPAYRVIRAHERAVLDRLVDLLDAGPAVRQDDAAALAQEICLLLEGAIAHRGIDGDDQLLTRAREVTARIIADHTRMPGHAGRSASIKVVRTR